MSLVPIKRVAMFGDHVARRATTDSPPGEMPMSPVARERYDPSPATPNAAGQPATLSEALAAGMREVWRGPNDGAYALLLDQSTNQVVLFGFPPASARRDDPGRAGPWSPAMVPSELDNGDREWDRATGATKDAATRAFEARVGRARTQIRMRSINDQNRARHGQPPVGHTGPFKPAA